MNFYDNVYNSELEIKQLSQDQTILDFALENADNRVSGFIVEPRYPSDAPAEREYYVILNRDQSGARILVELIPYNSADKNIYVRTIWDRQWGQTAWRKRTYAHIQKGTAHPNGEGIIQVTFEEEFNAIPGVILQNQGMSSDIMSNSKVYDITKTGFKAICLRTLNDTIDLDANATVLWIAINIT